MSANIIVFSSRTAEPLASVFANAVCSELPQVDIYATAMPYNTTTTDWEAIQANQPRIVCIVWDPSVCTQIQSLAEGLRSVNPDLPLVFLHDPRSTDAEVSPPRLRKVHVLVFPWRKGSLKQILGLYVGEDAHGHRPISKKSASSGMNR